MTHFLVTGGAGFIGSHLAAELLVRGHRVRVVDNLATGLLSNVPSGAEFVLGDLTDPDVAAEVTQGCDVVVHQAAIASVPQSISEPRPSHEANIDATFNVLIAARDAGVRRVVYAASSSAYGDSPVLPKVEDMAVDPLSPYALQKFVGEEYCRLFTRIYGLETVAIRYFNVFGPRQHPSSPYSGVLSLFIKCALSGTAPTIFGDGEQTRDFTFVDVINVATGVSVSLNRAWATLESILGRLQSPVFAAARAGDVYASEADIGKAERLLGFRPRVTFEEGLRRTVDWARSTL